MARLSIETLEPLRGLPIEILIAHNGEFRDLEPLNEMRLVELTLTVNRITDLSPLCGKSLRKLHIGYNNVSNLSPLRGAPIVEIDVQNNPIKDLTPLLDLPKLERLRISKFGKLFELEPLRRHPSLKYIAYDEEPHRPVVEFWADYDAKQAAGKK